MSKRRKSEDRTRARREFLKSVVAGSGATAIALMTGEAGAQPAPEPVAAPKPASSGYHVTQHILDYYKTARG